MEELQITINHVLAMNQEQVSYNKIMLWIDTSERNFDFRAAESLIYLFEKTFPDAKGLKKNLIDLLNDKQQELFKTNTNVKP